MENTNFKVYIEEKAQNYGKLFIEPLERGYGDTLGNALRRLLLSSIRGAAVTAVRIEGVLHEFSTIPGIREDVIEILMNLKHIPIRAKSRQAHLNEEGFKIITLDSDDLPKDFFTRENNPGVITAKDLPWDNDFEFCGEGVLCTLEPKAHIKRLNEHGREVDEVTDTHLLMEIYIEQGVGYLSAERERPSQPPLPVDALLTDAIFSPVTRVNYQIEPARVGQSIDFERLIIEVWTNGAITPEGAIGQAAAIARSYFQLIAETIGTATPVQLSPDGEVPFPPLPTFSTLSPSDESIHTLGLSIRSENCLLRGGIKTVGDLLMRSRDDLLKIRNLGKISLVEIEEILEKRGYQLSSTSMSVDDNAIFDDVSSFDEALDDFSSDKEADELISEVKEDAEKILDNVVEVPEPEEVKPEEISEPEAPAEVPEEKPTKPAKPTTKSTKSTKTTNKPAKPKPTTKKSDSRSKVKTAPAPAPEVPVEVVEPKAEVVEEVAKVEEPKPEAPKKTKKTSSKSKTKKADDAAKSEKQPEPAPQSEPVPEAAPEPAPAETKAKKEKVEKPKKPRKSSSSKSSSKSSKKSKAAESEAQNAETSENNNE